MEKYWLLFLLVIPLCGQSKCTPKGVSTATQPITLDLTTGSTTVSFNPNLQGSYECNSPGDKMYFATTLDDYIVEMKDGSSNKSIFIKLKLEADGFPVETSGSPLSPKTYSVADTINNKQLKLTASYIPPTTYESDHGEAVEGDSFKLKKAAANFLSDNKCSSNIITWIACYVFGLLNKGEAYEQKLTINVKHKPTTCRFSQPTYEIRMPETTISEMQSANNSKSGSVELALNCDSVYNVTTNPVTFKVERGVWDDSGTILKNTLSDGAKGVGFQIYNGNATTPLKLGDTLMNRLPKMAAIQEQYIFPITAKYVRVKEEALQPGEVQGQAIFAVSYD
ncbi:type 1 fimbrial protein [Escherichia coli]|nr:type 1 fimbrial protein [Escherichia coli]